MYACIREGDNKRREFFNLHAISPDTGLGTNFTHCGASGWSVCIRVGEIIDALHEESRSLRGRSLHHILKTHENP